MSPEEQRRRSVRRWTIGLVLLALAFYAGFILSGIYRAG